MSAEPARISTATGSSSGVGSRDPHRWLPGIDACRAVRNGEVLERPHHVDDELAVRPRHRVQRVVGVQALRGFTCADLDAGRRTELVGTEDAIEDTEDQRIDRGAVHRSRLPEQRVRRGGSCGPRSRPGRTGSTRRSRSARHGRGPRRRASSRLRRARTRPGPARRTPRRPASSGQRWKTWPTLLKGIC